jgi:hypothetical protein
MRSLITEPRHCECGDHAWAALTRGFVTLVSVDDSDLLRVKWHAHKTSNAYYAFRTIHIVGSWQPGSSGKRIAEYLHRTIHPGGLVDHKNHNTLDNRRGNLREATPAQSIANTRKSSRTLTSKYKGVCWDEGRQKWLVQLGSKYVGRFRSEQEAALAYDAAAFSVYGEYAKTNHADIVAGSGNALQK